MPGPSRREVWIRVSLIWLYCIQVLVQMQDTFWEIGRFLPLPRAGEGRGEGVFGYDFVGCFSLTLALSQRERELLFPQEVS
jgi:hypothetical protein